MDLKQKIELIKDLVMPRQKGCYTVGFDDGQPDFEAQNQEPNGNRSYLIRALQERNKKYWR